MTSICISGATGWVGEPLARAVVEADDLTLTGAVARSAAGRRLHDVTIAATVAEALDAAPATDVLIDYTAPGAVRGNVDEALSRGIGVVVGTSGLTASDYEELDARARETSAGVIAAGNFSVMVAVLQHAALLAAQRLDAWEVIDYASAGKPDAPSGTARELAERLSEVRAPAPTPLGDDLVGPPETRGARIGETQVHSLRLPSFTVSTEVVFGGEDERLSLRHDASAGAAPYIAGTLLAARRVTDRVGVTRGLDQLLFE